MRRNEIVESIRKLTSCWLAVSLGIHHCPGEHPYDRLDEYKQLDTTTQLSHAAERPLCFPYTLCGFRRF